MPACQILLICQAFFFDFSQHSYILQCLSLNEVNVSIITNSLQSVCSYFNAIP